MNYQTTNNFSKQRVYLFWLGCFSRLALLLVVPLLIYYGYCWGVWGRNSLFLQHLFQCSCPVISEEARYPKEVDVVVSACHESWVDLSPSGRLLYVREKDLVLASNYLLDLETMERVDITNQPYSTFLTDELGLVENGLENYIIDRTTGKQYPIQKFRYLRPDTQVNGDVDLTKLAEALKKSNAVYYIDGNRLIVALSSDFRNSSEHSFLSGWYDIPGFNTDRTELFLRENEINFHPVVSFPDEVVSPDGRFVARREGIFLSETNQKIVDGVSLWLRGWTNDGRGVIYSPRYGGRCLLRLSLPMGDDSWCEIDVPQPVIKLKVPEEYLSSTAIP